MNTIESIFAFIITPFSAIDEAKKESNVLRASAIVLLSLISITIAAHVFSGITITPLVLALYVSFLSLVGVFLWILSSAFFHLWAEVSGGTGTVGSLMHCIGFSSVPALLFVPVSLTVVFIGYYPAILFLLCAVLLGIWAVLLSAFSVARLYSLGMVRSLFIVTSPLYIIPLFVISMILLLVLGIYFVIVTAF